MYNSIMKSKKKIRIDLFENIVLSGGSTMFNGIVERIRKEIVALAPVDTGVKIIANHHGQFASWIGGALGIREKWVNVCR